MRPVHVVQIGYDDSVFAPDAASDTRLRQKLYAELLMEKRPGSRMTVLTLTRRADYRPAQDGPATFMPVAGRGVLRLLKLFGQLLALNRACKIDVVAAQTIFADAWVALAFAALTGARVIGQIHMDIFSPHIQSPGHGGISQWRMRVGLSLMRQLKAVRVVSQHLRSEILGQRLHHDVGVVPVPVTMLETSSSPLPTQKGEQRQVLYVGRLEAEKNLWRWLRVAKRIAEQETDVEFVWAGDGELRSELLAEAERLGLGSRFRCLGPIPYDQLPGVYKSAAVFLLTSDHESFGRVLVEAGWHGLPVVAPRLAGIEGVVRNGETGYLCAPGDETALADSVVRLLHDPILAARMGAAAQAQMKLKFDPQRLAAQWVDMLLAAAEGRA
jgi:glycosyltransferase involved in cell wall biosynthesis